MSKRRYAAAISAPIFLTFAIISATAAPATSAPMFTSQSWLIPGAKSAEGIAMGEGSTFFAGDEFGADIYRGDMTTGHISKFIDVPDGILDSPNGPDGPAGTKMAVGMKVDTAHNLLFVAGGLDGTARVYDTDTGAKVADFVLDEGGGINDVALNAAGAWFTDSYKSQLYFIPVNGNGQVQSPQTLALSGPAADTSGAFNNNGIAVAPDGSLIVDHTGQGSLNKVDPVTGASSTIPGVSLPNGADGMIRKGETLYVAHAYSHEIAEVRLRMDTQGHVAGGRLIRRIQSSDFHTPTTIGLFGNQLAVVNSHILNETTGQVELPSTSSHFEVVSMDLNP